MSPASNVSQEGHWFILIQWPSFSIDAVNIDAVNIDAVNIDAVRILVYKMVWIKDFKMMKIPLALLPGTLCTGLLWREQIKSLCDIADIHVINTAEHDSLPALAHHVHSVMPAPFAVAGLSYGGIVALSVWRHNPEAISHLALMNTTPLPITPEKQIAQESQMEMALAGKFHEIVSQQASALLSLAGREEDEAYYANIMTMAEAVGVHGFVNQIKAQIQRPDSRPILNQIACPTLLLCGDRDVLCPPDLHREMAEKIPRSSLHIVPECGHLSSMEKPEAVSDAMKKWLALSTLK